LKQELPPETTGRFPNAPSAFLPFFKGRPQPAALRLRR